jgi:hypothetical protein
MSRTFEVGDGLRCDIDRLVEQRGRLGRRAALVQPPTRQSSASSPAMVPNG